MRVTKTILYTFLAVAATSDAKLFGKEKRECHPATSTTAD